MKISMVAGLLGGLGVAARGQTWDEWWHQKKTRLKYLRRQVAELIALEKTVKTGYQVAASDVLHIADVRGIEYAAHFSFFKSLQAIDPAVGHLSVMHSCLEMEARCLSEMRLAIPEFGNSRFLSPEEKTVILAEIAQASRVIETDVMPMVELLRPDALKMMDGDRIDLLSAYVEELKLRSWKVLSMLSQWWSLVDARQKVYEETDYLQMLLP